MQYAPVIDRYSRTIEKAPIDELIHAFGSPLFIIVERIVRQKYALFADAIRPRCLGAVIAYSVKTNHLPKILALMRTIGCYTEVTSGFEYRLARRSGFTGPEIVFNGPDKKDDELREAFRDGAIINIDNWEEIRRIAYIAKQLGSPCAIGLRVHYENGGASWTRFGFNINNGEAIHVTQTIQDKYPELIVSGFHIHVGTDVLNLELYKKASEGICKLVCSMPKTAIQQLKFVNFGGGFAVPGASEHDAPIRTVPKIEDYIHQITEVLSREYPGPTPQLFFEPGRYLVEEAGIFLTSVVNAGIRESTQYATVDGSIYTHFSPAQYKVGTCNALGRRTIGASEKSMPTWVGGNSCIGSDFFVRNSPLPLLYKGDAILFYNAGAYSMCRAEQWIHPRPAAVLIKINGAVECMRQRDTDATMLCLDQ